MQFDYPGGVMDWERPMIERFERDVLPYTIKHGPHIGDSAMKGNVIAEEIIRRHRLFVEGLPELRATNFNLLVNALKLWEKQP